MLCFYLFLFSSYIQPFSLPLISRMTLSLLFYLCFRNLICQVGIAIPNSWCCWKIKWFNMCKGLVLCLIQSKCLINVNCMWYGSLPKFDFDFSLMKPHMFPEDMERDYCSYNNAFWGSQAGLKMSWGNSNRRHRAGVTVLALYVRLVWFEIPTNTKGWAPGLSNHFAQIWDVRAWWNLKLSAVRY